MQSVFTDLVTGFRLQSLSVGILNGSRVSSELVAIQTFARTLVFRCFSFSVILFLIRNLHCKDQAALRRRT